MIGNDAAGASRSAAEVLNRVIFDKETRRKPLEFAGDAAAMAIGGCFGTHQRGGIAGGLVE